MRNRPSLDFLSGAAFRWFVIVFGPVVLGLLVITKSFPGLVNPEAMEMAQVARNLSQTGHYRTQSIRPLSLLFAPSVEHSPELYHAPLHPVLLSVVFRLWEAGDKPVAATGVVLWMVAFWMTLAISRRLFSWRVAGLAAILLVCNIRFLALSISGTAAMLAAVIVLLLLWTLYRHEPVRADGEEEGGGTSPLPVWRLAVAGALVGAATLARYPLIALTLPVLIYAGYDQRRVGWWRCAVVLLAAAVVLLPWIAHNWVTTGSPFFTLQLYEVAAGTGTYPGDTVYRTLDSEVARDALPFAFGWHHLGELAIKVKAAVRGAQGAAADALGALVAAFFLASMFLGFGDGGISRLRRCFYGMFIVWFGAMAFMRFQAADVALFAPFATVLAAAGLRRLIGSIDLPSLRLAWQGRDWRLGAPTAHRLVVLTAIVALAALPFSSWLRGRSDAAVRASLPKLEWLKPTSQPAPLIMTDVPHAVAWYCDRPAVWLTDSSRTYDRLDKELGPIGVLHFLGLAFDLSRPEQADWWRVAYGSNTPYKGLVQVGRGGGSPREKIRTLPELARAPTSDDSEVGG